MAGLTSDVDPSVDLGESFLSISAAMFSRKRSASRLACSKLSRLSPFRNSDTGFVRAAIETRSPLIPIVTIGGDEIYPLLGNIKPLAKLINAPYFPVTPFFPWLPFPFNIMPLPIKILIVVWRPFRLKYTPEVADDETLVGEITNDIHNEIQGKVDDLLEIRTSPFKRWNIDKVNAYLENTKSYSPHMEKHRNQS